MKIDFTTAIRSLLLLLIGFIATSASAQTLEIDGIGFKLNDNGTCSVVSFDCATDYYDPEKIRKFVVPESVEYEGRAYTVTTIAIEREYDIWVSSPYKIIETLSLPSTIGYIEPYSFLETEIEELILRSAYPPRATCASFGVNLPEAPIESFLRRAMIYKIVVPEGSSYLYKRAPGWHFYSDIMEESQEPGTIPADDKRFIRNGWMADRIVSSGDSSESIRLLYQTVTGEAKPLTLPSSFEYGGRTLEVTELGDESLIYTPYTELILSPNIRRIGDCPLIYSSISRIRGIERVEELGNSVAICAALREFKLPRSINKLQGNMFFFGGSPHGCFDLIELHKDVSHIESHTFYNVSVRNLVCHNPVPPTTKEYTFIFEDHDILELDTLHVPGGSIEAYREAPGWREFKEIVAIGPADVKDAAVNAVPEVASDGLAITVKSEGHLSVEVVDISGRVEVSASGFGEISHRVGSPGVYIVRVSTPTGLHVSKINISER